MADVRVVLFCLRQGSAIDKAIQGQTDEGVEAEGSEGHEADHVRAVFIEDNLGPKPRKILFTETVFRGMLDLVQSYCNSRQMRVFAMDSTEKKPILSGLNVLVVFETNLSEFKARKEGRLPLNQHAEIQATSIPTAAVSLLNDPAVPEPRPPPAPATTTRQTKTVQPPSSAATQSMNFRPKKTSRALARGAFFLVAAVCALVAVFVAPDPCGHALIAQNICGPLFQKDVLVVPVDGCHFDRGLLETVLRNTDPYTRLSVLAFNQNTKTLVSIGGINATGEIKIKELLGSKKFDQIHLLYPGSQMPTSCGSPTIPADTGLEELIAESHLKHKNVRFVVYDATCDKMAELIGKPPLDVVCSKSESLREMVFKEAALVIKAQLGLKIEVTFVDLSRGKPLADVVLKDMGILPAAISYEDELSLADVNNAYVAKLNKQVNEALSKVFSKECAEKLNGRGIRVAVCGLKGTLKSSFIRSVCEVLQLGVQLCANFMASMTLTKSHTKIARSIAVGSLITLIDTEGLPMITQSTNLVPILEGLRDGRYHNQQLMNLANLPTSSPDPNFAVDALIVRLAGEDDEAIVRDVRTVYSNNDQPVVFIAECGDDADAYRSELGLSPDEVVCINQKALQDHTSRQVPHQAYVVYPPSILTDVFGKVRNQLGKYVPKTCIIPRNSTSSSPATFAAAHLSLLFVIAIVIADQLFGFLI